ncbi:putative non-specific serine/threonine protein kinase [Helianthus debilis subsp. tardiflorus]
MAWMILMELLVIGKKTLLTLVAGLGLLVPLIILSLALELLARVYQEHYQRLLQNNNISGQIPAGIGHLKKLQTLDLSNNKLTGHVPESLSLLTSLQYLLSGAIPLSSAPQLALLDLSNNNLIRLNGA